MYYKCKHFRIEELVDKFTFNKFGELSWQFFNVNYLKMIDEVWEYFGVTITMNDWVWQGKNQFRGLRPYYVTIGAKFSAHKFATGADMIFKGMESDDVRNRIIIDQGHPLLKRITRIEADTAHIHIDCMNIPDAQRIKVIYP